MHIAEQEAPVEVNRLMGELASVDGKGRDIV
jgi:hypothetical protein